MEILKKTRKNKKKACREDSENIEGISIATVWKNLEKTRKNKKKTHRENSENTESSPTTGVWKSNTV